MEDRDHRERIRSLVSAGKLDEAVDALRRADDEGRKTGLDVLVPLSRALLAHGREADALHILERASSFAVFGGTLDKIATEIGLPQRKPGGAPVGPESATAQPVETPKPAPSRLRQHGHGRPGLIDEPSVGTPTKRISIRDEGPPTVENHDIEGFDTPISPMKLDPSATIASKMPFDALDLSDADCEDPHPTDPTDGDEDRETIQLAVGAHDGSPDSEPAPLPFVLKTPAELLGGDLGPSKIRRDTLRAPTAPSEITAEREPDGLDTDRVTVPRSSQDEELDTDQIRMPSGHGGARPGAGNLDQETERILLPPQLEEDEADTDEVSLPPRRSNGRDVAATPGATERAAPQEESDPTRKLNLAEIQVIEGTRPRRDTIQDIVAGAKELRAACGDITNKLQLAEVEVVGFFEAGGKKIVVTRGPSLQVGYATDEPDFSLVPDSDDLAGAAVDKGLGARVESISLPIAQPVEVTERVRCPPERPLPEPPRPVARPESSRPTRGVAIAVVVGICIAAGAAISTYLWREHVETRELERVHDLLADDTFESHRQAMTTLGVLSGRYRDGLACAEFASEAATMWGRFGLGEEHAEAAQRALQSCPGVESTEAGTLASTLLSLYRGELDEALSAVEGGLVSFPQSVRLRVAKASILEARGEIDMAQDELETAHDLDPVDIPAALSLARIHRRAGRRGDARLLLEGVRRTSPRHIEARAEELMLTLDTLEGERPSQAELEELRTLSASLEASAQEQPPAIAALASLARGRLALLQGNVEHAGVLLGRAWRQGTRSQEAALHVARGLRLAGELAGALEVSKRQPHDTSEMRVERMQALLAAGRPGPVLAELHEVQRSGESGRGSGVDPFDPTARVRLEAWALEQQDDLAAGCALVERRIQAAPDSETRLLLAEMYRARGNWNEAGRLLRSVSAEPWAACAEATRLELEGQYRQALEVLDARGERRAPCTLRIRSLLSRRVGDPISEISALRTLLRVESRFDDRIALAWSVWRERGANAALAEIRTMLEAPPTGAAPLMAMVDLLATLGAEEQLEVLLAGARTTGAERALLATATARGERLRGRPEAAFELLDEDVGANLTAATLERGLASLDHRDPIRALEAVARVRAEAGSREWATVVKIQATAIRRRSGSFEADQILDRAIRQAEELGNQAAVLDLALQRVEGRLAAGSSGAEVQALLRGLPSWPPDPRTRYLSGRLAEAQGNPERAIAAYREVLHAHPGHIDSLRRLSELTSAPEYERRLAVLLLSHELPSRDVSATEGEPR